jgi:methylated-DNA-[protein]-cysteine S-methyltransferase
MIDLTRALRNGHDDQREQVAAATAAALARADREGLVDVAVATVDSPIGTLSLAATPAGLVRVGFPREEGEFVEELASSLSPRIVALPSRLDDARRQLDEYFEGRRHTFDLRVDLALSKGFRRTVLERLFADVGYGETLSYLELAERAGNPRASRAVGSAMATNPVPIVVPCHRVLRTGGQLGGYGGGLDVKRWLLALEGAGGQLSFPG